ncbi:MAG: hypothetical protein WA066_02980 [Candidatus Omnitrophota bacterium]
MPIPYMLKKQTEEAERLGYTSTEILNVISESEHKDIASQIDEFRKQGGNDEEIFRGFKESNIEPPPSTWKTTPQAVLSLVSGAVGFGLGIASVPVDIVSQLFRKSITSGYDLDAKGNIVKTDKSDISVDPREIKTVRDSIAEFLTYMPKDPRAQYSVEKLTTPFRKYDELKGAAGEWYAEKWGDTPEEKEKIKAWVDLAGDVPYVYGPKAVKSLVRIPLDKSYFRKMSEKAKVTANEYAEKGKSATPTKDEIIPTPEEIIEVQNIKSARESFWAMDKAEKEKAFQEAETVRVKAFQEAETARHQAILYQAEAITKETGKSAEESAKVFDSTESKLQELDIMVNEIKIVGNEIGYNNLKSKLSVIAQRIPEFDSKIINIKPPDEATAEIISHEINKLNELRKTNEEITGMNLKNFYDRAIENIINRLPEEIKNKTIEKITEPLIEVKSAIGERKITPESGFIDLEAVKQLAEKLLPRAFRPSPKEVFENAKDEVVLNVQRQENFKTLKERFGFTFKTTPIEYFKSDQGKALAFSGLKQNLKFRHQYETIHFMLEELVKTVNKDERITITSLLKEIEEGKQPLSAIESLPENQKTFAYTVRGLFDDVKTQFIDMRQKLVRDTLNPDELAQIEALENGVKVKVSDKVQTAYDSMQEIKNWGYENYITRMGRGHVMAVTKEGKVIELGQTIAEVKSVVKEYLKENPDVKEINIYPEFFTNAEIPVHLSGGAFWKLVGDVAKDLDITSKEVLEAIHKDFPSIAIKPTFKFAGPVLKRKGLYGGVQDISEVLPIYSYIMLKKIYLDPFIKEAKTHLGDLYPAEKPAMEDFIKDVKGRMHPLDKFTDDLISYLPIISEHTKPFLASNIIRRLKQGVAISKLGYRPIAGFVNFASGQMHNWTKLGTELYAETIKYTQTEAGKKLIAENEWLLGLDSTLSESAFGRTKSLLSPLGIFRMPEPFNRKVAFVGEYLRSRNSGMSHIETIDSGVKAVSAWQFFYDVASLPKWARTPEGSLILQFKPFLFKELEFISSLKGGEIPRYMFGFLTLGGPKAAMAIIKSLPILGSLGLLDDAEEYIIRKYPRLSRGIGGFAGVDISPSVAYQFPNKVEQWGGIFFNDMYNLYDKILKPELEGIDIYKKDIANYTIRLAPIIYSWDKLIDAEIDNEGWVKNNQGKRLYKLQGWDWAKLISGAKPLGLSQYEYAAWYAVEKESINRKNRSKALEEYVRVIKLGDKKDINEMEQKLEELGINVDSIKEAIKTSGITAEQWIEQRTTKAKREETMKKFKEATEPFKQ